MPFRGHQFRGDGFRTIDRDRKTQACARPGTHQGVNADHLALGIQQRASRISGINRRIRLDEICLLYTSDAADE